MELKEFIWVLVNKMTVLEKARLSCCGITVGQCHAIREIGAGGSLSLGELSETMGLDKSTLSRTVDALVKSGLVDRSQDSENRRYVKLGLTSQGKVVYDMIDRILVDFTRTLTQDLTAEEREGIQKSIQILGNRIREWNP